jgi:transposase
VDAVDDPTDPKRLLDAAIEGCESFEAPELCRLGGTLERWSTEIVNHHCPGDSNGPMEATSLLVQEVKRAGCGVADFEHYRLPLPSHCGLIEQTRRAAIRAEPTGHRPA